MYIQEILKQKWVIPVAAGAASAVVGFGTGFLIGRRTGRDEVFDVIDATIGDLKEHTPEPEFTPSEVQEYLKAKMEADFQNSLLEGDGTGVPIGFIDEELTEQSDDLDVVPDEDVEVVESEVIEFERVNVFVDPASGEEWDEEAEVAARIDGEPYVISVEEFMENANEWSQETMTYYEGDDIVANAEEVPIYGHAALMGPLKFGHGSGDKNVVYIRSEKYHKEWEVLRHQGRYEFEVAGQTIEQEFEERDLKHSNDRKFRSD